MKKLFLSLLFVALANFAHAASAAVTFDPKTGLLIDNIFVGNGKSFSVGTGGTFNWNTSAQFTGDSAAFRAAIGVSGASFDGTYASLTGKPALGTSAALNIPAIGNAASTEVVKGSDTRLTDTRLSPATAVTAGTYGDGTHVAAFTVGPDGRLTFAGPVAITVAGTGDVTTAFTVSVDGEGVEFSGTGGKALKRSAKTGIIWENVGVRGQVTVNGPLAFAAGVLSIPTGTNSVDGFLTAADHTLFNAKQPAGSYITGITGDLVATGPGSVAGTIQANVVSNAKLSQMAANTIKGNNTGILANALDLTAAQVATLISGQTMNIVGNASTVTTNANSTGDVTSVGNATAIAANVVTNAKAAPMAAHTHKGNNTGSAANPIDLTVAQLLTDISLDQVNNTTDANKPISTAQATVNAQKANLAGGNSISGVQTYSGAQVLTPIAVPALAIDFTVPWQTKTVSSGTGDITITYSGSPATGTLTTIEFDNTDTVKHRVTHPSSTAPGGAVRTYFDILPSGKEVVTIEKTAAGYNILGSPQAGYSAEETIASATTVDLSTLSNLNVAISGTVTTTGYGAGTGVPVGTVYNLRATGAYQLTNSGTLINITGANITTVSGDVYTERFEGSSTWRMLSYTRATGAALTGGGGGSGVANTLSVAQTSHGFSLLQAVYFNGTTWVLSKADALATSKVHGVVSTVTDANNFIITESGSMTTSAWSTNTVYYLSDATAGLLTTTAPTTTTSFLVTVATTGSATQAFVQISNPASLSTLGFADGGTSATTGYGAFDALSIHGADVASAGTLNLDTTTGSLVDVTGTTGITAITLSDGRMRTVRFTGILTLTNGSSLVLPGGANITTAAGDYAIFRGYAAGVVRCAVYSKASGAAITGSGGAAQLTPTAVKVAGYTAVAGDLVLVDTTSGAVTITLPTAPADKAIVAVKMINQGGTNVTTINTGGSDVFNKTGGLITGNFTLLNQAATFQYQSSTSIWITISSDLPKTSLLAAAQTWTGQQTFVAPILGTPSSGVATNLTGTAAGLTAGTVTTNANMTGNVTSVGNATTIPASVVTNAMHTNMAAHTFKGNNTGSASAPLDLTISQMQSELGSGPSINLPVAQTTHGFTLGQAVFYNGTAWVLSKADALATSVVHGVVNVVVDANNFTVVQSGQITTLTSLTANSAYYLSDATAGLLTTTKPSTLTSYIVPVMSTGSTTLAYVQISPATSLALIGTNDFNPGLTADTGTSLTITTAMDYITFNNAGTNTPTLPTLASSISANPTKVYHIKNLGAGLLNVTPNGAETIFYLTSGNTVLTLKQGESCDLVATATQWLVR